MKSQVTGDVQGLPFGSQIVTALQGRPISGVAPTKGQALSWNGTAWVPATAFTPTDPGTNKVWGSNGSGSALGVFPPGYEIGYNQITANVPITGTTAGTSTLVITSSGYTFDGGPVICEFYSPDVSTPTVAGDVTVIGLFESTTLLAEIGFVQTPAAATTGIAMNARFRFSPSGGVHTYLIRAWASHTTGSPTVSAGSGTSGAVAPAYLRFFKV